MDSSSWCYGFTIPFVAHSGVLDYVRHIGPRTTLLQSQALYLSAIFSLHYHSQCIKNVHTPLHSILATSVSVVLPRLSVYRPPDPSSPMNLLSPPDLGCMITALPRLATAGQALLQSVLAISYCLCQAIISHLCPNSAQKSESRVFT